MYWGLFKHGQAQDLWDFVKAVVLKMQSFLCNGDQQYEERQQRHEGSQNE
jgi:hypothetical protein